MSLLSMQLAVTNLFFIVIGISMAASTSNGCEESKSTMHI